MYIWDPNKSQIENLNIQAQVEAQERIAEMMQRQSGHVPVQSTGTSWFMIILYIIFLGPLIFIFGGFLLSLIGIHILGE